MGRFTDSTDSVEPLKVAPYETPVYLGGIGVMSPVRVLAIWNKPSRKDPGPFLICEVLEDVHQDPPKGDVYSALPNILHSKGSEILLRPWDFGTGYTQAYEAMYGKTPGLVKR